MIYNIAAEPDVTQSDASYDVADASIMYGSTPIPSQKQPHIVISLYRNVTNAADLRKRLIARDEVIDAALIDAKMIISVSQVQAAAMQALLHARASHTPQSLNTKLKTHNINSEILYCLCPTTNISDAIRRFGINDETTEILAVKVIDQDGPSPDDVLIQLGTIISGKVIDLTDIPQYSDANRIRKIYKIPAHQDMVASIPDVINTIAVKDIL